MGRGGRGRQGVGFKLRESELSLGGSQVWWTGQFEAGTPFGLGLGIINIMADFLYSLQIKFVRYYLCV